MKTNLLLENNFDLLGSGIPDAHYHERGRAFGAATFVGAVVIGFYLGVTHADQAQNILQTGFEYMHDAAAQLFD